MVIIFFSGNLHKAREISDIFVGAEVRIYTEFMESFEVIESGKSFAENATLKVNALHKKMLDLANLGELSRESKRVVLMAEDSGICVESLDNLPNIFSARFANLPKDLLDSPSLADGVREWVDSSDKDNIARLIRELKARDLRESKAQFVSCIACKVLQNAKSSDILTTHGFLNGKVICEVRGENGFGYDPIFIPNGFRETLAELPSKVKNALSHRKNALDLMKLLLK